MGLTIIKQFDMRRRRLYRDGKWQEVDMAAFVGATGSYCPGRAAQFGIGLMRQEKGDKKNTNYLFWGSSTMHFLVTAWRAAQIVDMATDIRESVLFSAFMVASRVRAPKFQSYVDILSEAMPYIAVEDLRMRALSDWLITDEELDSMLEVCDMPDANIKVSAQELQEELVEGIIRCTAGVRQVFGRAELEGEKLSHIIEMSKLPLPTEQSFGNLCKQAKIKHLCSCMDDVRMLREGLTGIDQFLVYNAYRYGTGRNILCSVRCSGRLERIGNPVVRLRGGDEWILREVRYYARRMLVEAYALSGREKGRVLTMPVYELLNLAPRMAGVTFTDSEMVDKHDYKRGYCSIEPLWQRLLNKFYEIVFM